MTTGTNKRCIISFANHNGRYVTGLARLSESLRNNFDGDFLSWVGESSLGAPLHAENPYAFKIYAFDKAIEAGYTQILWLDSSVFAIKNVQPVFDEIEKTGYIMQDAGHYLSDWCNDETLAFFGISKKEAESIKMIGNAGMLGIDMNHGWANKFYYLWKDAMQCGMFKGSWENHRHDMSCSSALKYKLNLQPVRGDEWLQYAGVYDETANDTIIFKAQGI